MRKIQRVLCFSIALGLFLLPLTRAEDNELRDENGNVMHCVSGWGGPFETGSAGFDVNGEVGHPLNVEGLKSLYITDHTGSPVKWSAEWAVVEGSFPPGIHFNNDSSIGGIPTERGHWIVTLRAYNLRMDICAAGPNPPSFTQQLRFHITGSGKVIE
jgi:hypothetical protein